MTTALPGSAAQLDTCCNGEKKARKFGQARFGARLQGETSPAVLLQLVCSALCGVLKHTIKRTVTLSTLGLVPLPDALIDGDRESLIRIFA